MKAGIFVSGLSLVVLLQIYFLIRYMQCGAIKGSLI